MKRVLGLAMSLIMVFTTIPFAITASADELTTGKCGKNVTYSFNSQTGKLTISGKGAMTDYYVYINDKKSPFYNNSDIKTVEIKNGVTSIGNEAFCFCESLTSITIPNSVTKIGNYAFEDCKELTSISTGNGVKSIGRYAFEFCQSLKSVTIGNSLKSISKNLFEYCSKLKSITVSDKNKNYSSKNGVLFNKKKTKLIYYPVGKTTKTYSIPNSVKSIGSEAFWGCKKLISVAFGKKVKTISDYAFYSCESLKSLKIPNSVTKIGEFAFSDCIVLKSIKIGNGLTSIGSNVFNNTAYFYKKSNWKNKVLYIGNYLFSGTYHDNASKYADDYYIEYESVKGNYSVKSGTKVIADSAFYDCKELKSVSISNSVKNIGNGAFDYCSSLKSIKVTAKNKNYSSKKGILFNKKKTKIVFYPPKINAKSYSTPSNVTSIGKGAFLGCQKLKSVKINKNVKKIGANAFDNCKSLKSIKIGNGVTSIGKDAFNNTAYFHEKSNWKNKVLYIGNYLITGSYHEKGEYYHKFERVEGNYSVKSGTKVIADSAFFDCTALQSVKIPKSVKNIGTKALGYYSLKWYNIIKKLKDITINGYKGTIAQKYANKNGFKFKKI